MRHGWAWGIALGVVLASCGGGDGGDIDPSNVRTEQLYGYWVSRDQGTERVFVFAAAEDAADLFNLNEGEVASDASAVYVDGVEVQIATYAVEDGYIQQAVVHDDNAAPGAAYRTRIVAFSAGRSLTIETTEGDRRTYDSAPRCPIANRVGWLPAAVGSCPTVFHTAASAVVDRHGDVHSVLSTASPESPSPNCRPGPVYGVLRGCVPRRYQSPNASGAAQAIDHDQDVIHQAFVLADVGIANDHAEGTVVYRTRGLRDRTWTEEVVGTGVASRPKNVLLAQHDDRVVILVQANGVPIRRYERSSSGWEEGQLLVDAQPLAGPVGGSTFDSDGNLIVLVNSLDRGLYRETHVGVFEELPRLPGGSAPIAAGLFVDGQQRLHAIGSAIHPGEQAEWPSYAMLDLNAGTWELFRIGDLQLQLTMLLPRAQAPWGLVRHIPLRTNANYMALTEIETDGQQHTTLLQDTSDPGLAIALNQPTATSTASQGPDGSIAVSTDGSQLHVRLPAVETPIADSTLEITIGGEGTGRVVDPVWNIDCRATCRVELPRGAVPSLEFIADEGFSRPLSGFVHYPEHQIDDRSYPVDGRAVMELPIADPELTLDVEFGVPVIRDEVLIGTPGVDAVTHFDAGDGRWLAVAATGDGSVRVDGTSINARGEAGTTLLLDDGTMTRGVALDVEPLAVSLLTAGGAVVLAEVMAPTTIGSTMVGTSNQRTAVWIRIGADGAIVEVEALDAVSINAAKVAAAVDRAGTAAVLYANNSGFAELGLSETTALMIRDTAGDQRSLGFDLNGLPSPAYLAVDGDRVAFVARTNVTSGAFVSVDGASIAPVRLANEGAPLAIAFDATGVWTLWQVQSGFDLGADAAITLSGATWAAARFDGAGAFGEGLAIAGSFPGPNVTAWLVPTTGAPAYVLRDPAGFTYRDARHTSAPTSVSGFAPTLVRSESTTSFWALGIDPNGQYALRRFAP